MISKLLESIMKNGNHKNIRILSLLQKESNSTCLKKVISSLKIF